MVSPQSNLRLHSFPQVFREVGEANVCNGMLLFGMYLLGAPNIWFGMLRTIFLFCVVVQRDYSCTMIVFVWVGYGTWFIILNCCVIIFSVWF